MIRRTGLVFVLVAAALALPAAGSGSAVPSGYRVLAIERLTTGAPGASPDLGLVARIDNGTGGAAPYATGEVTWTLDRRQLGPGSIEDLVTAPTGTQFGWVASGPTGGSAVQMPLRKTGVELDGGDPVVDAAFDVPAEFAPVVGATAPVTIRVRPPHLLVTLNIQAAVGRFRASGIGDVIVDLVGVYLFGTYTSAGETKHIAVNPMTAGELELGVSAKPCADAACSRLGTAVTDTLALSLPKVVTVRAPRRAIYGQKAIFGGTAAPGDTIHVAYLREAGGEPACTPTSVNAPTPCSPRYAAAYDRLVETATTRPDGRWSDAVVLRSVLLNGSLGLAHPATGRYAAVVYTGDVLEGIPSFNGGRFTIFAAPEVETEVKLAKPRVALRPLGRSVRVAVSVPGGDPFVHVQLNLGRRELASGQLDRDGVLRTTIVGPLRPAVLRATASVSGATSSTTRVVLRLRGGGR
jgi:hypothetical protein